jgi:hypothetical protein
MTRYVLAAPVTIPPTGYATPGKVLPKGTVVELSAAEVSAVNAINASALRTGATARDAMGEPFGVSNSTD